MRPRDRDLARRLSARLEAYDLSMRALPGIANQESREVLIEQLLASVHRVEYVKRLGQRELSACRADPNDARFDPLKAARLHIQAGQVEEACWLVFLSVHFSKHSKGGWRYLREVYGRLGSRQKWDWTSIRAAPGDFRAWLEQYGDQLRRPGAKGGFGNHRKYESLDGYSPSGTGSVVESYVQWVVRAGSHERLIQDALLISDADSRVAFDYLYKSMGANVIRFGRLARFDYLTMLAKLGLAAIEPGSTYLTGATGPLRGARLLFGSDEKAPILDDWLVLLDDELGVGMQVLEDALCNWQKSPDRYEPFRD